MKMISLRLNDKELEALEQAAKADKLKLTTWIKQAALKAADTKIESKDSVISKHSGLNLRDDMD